MTEELVKQFMREALLEAKNSPDPSTQNGAVIVYYDKFFNTYKIVGKGCNTFHKGVSHLPLSNKLTKNLYIEHAERMAIYDMVNNLHDEVFKYSKTWKGELIMFCTDTPCNACANSIVGHNIKTIYTFNPQKEESSWKEYCDAGARIINLTGGKIIYTGSDYRYGIELLKSGELKEY